MSALAQEVPQPLPPCGLRVLDLPDQYNQSLSLFPCHPLPQEADIQATYKRYIAIKWSWCILPLPLASPWASGTSSVTQVRVSVRVVPPLSPLLPLSVLRTLARVALWRDHAASYHRTSLRGLTEPYMTYTRAVTSVTLSFTPASQASRLCSQVTALLSLSPLLGLCEYATFSISPTPVNLSKMAIEPPKHVHLILLMRLCFVLFLNTMYHFTLCYIF